MAIENKEEVDYLSKEVNLISPGTDFMRESLFIIWTTFIIWVVVVFGGPILLWLTAETATGAGPLWRARFLGFPFAWWMTAQGSPLTALVLSGVFAYRMDSFHSEYGILDEDDDEEAGH
ncbi:DUF4212 domain-containing protein [Fuchsiella alkaliacetigena]|uniref:DUF4212 domain-containing protein n=1 Tax=Fuchsiella alkaliacetigena TaxID=957042 RepID=UPI00200ABD74|nr:DUF4212 domain-containing protein [Fuchsiella alkaliacetigena]MCK8823789.1 DUF4212 domain-containing protein [Fuchsiella alkaliacetigena]